MGDEGNVRSACAVVNELFELSKKGVDITAQEVQYLLDMEEKDLEEHSVAQLQDDCIAHTTMGKPIKPKYQKQSPKMLKKHPIT